MLHRRRTTPEGVLDDPAAILGPLEHCMLHCLRASPTGWSSTAHLATDLQRFFGLEVTARAIGRAVRELGATRSIHIVVDDTGTVWYRIRPA